MEVFAQSVHDHLTGEEIWIGIDVDECFGPAYRKAMDYINKHQEWRGGERLEYFGNTAEIKFIWDMTDKEFKDLMAPLSKEGSEEPDYLGALFFGNFKLEFIKSARYGGYRNLFQYGAQDDKNMAYSYLEDGTPYEERFPESEEFKIPMRRTFKVFAENIEEQVIKFLNRYPIYIEDALKPTVPSNWYPGERHNYVKDFSREA